MKQKPISGKSITGKPFTRKPITGKPFTRKPKTRGMAMALCVAMALLSSLPAMAGFASAGRDGGAAPGAATDAATGAATDALATDGSGADALEPDGSGAQGHGDGFVDGLGEWPAPGTQSTAAAATASISGLIWADGDGSLPTDWDGRRNGGERPIAGYAVYLFSSDDLSIALVETRTGADGTYTFSRLAPGSYVVGIASGTVGGVGYTLPHAMAGQSRFGIGRAGGLMMALTVEIELGEGQAAGGMDAGLWLPMADAPAEAGGDGPAGEAGGADAALDAGGVEVTAPIGGEEDAAALAGGEEAQGHAGGEEAAAPISGEAGAAPDAGGEEGAVGQIGGEADAARNPGGDGEQPPSGGGALPPAGDEALEGEALGSEDADGEALGGEDADGAEPGDGAAVVDIDDEDMLVPLGPAVKHTVIPIGAGAPEAGDHRGYSIGASGGRRTLAFNQDANSGTYEITQDGDPGHWNIIVPDGVDTTLTLNSVALESIYEFITVEGNARLALLLEGANRLDGPYINVKAPAELVIDSAASPGGEEGSLTVIGKDPDAAGIGGKDTQSGLVTINGGTVSVSRADMGDYAYAAAIGGGKGHAGRVAINGGRVSASTTAYDYGAAIGGGLGSAGKVSINGGAVDAASDGGGAAIGGGHGQGGKGDVYIKGGAVDAKSNGGGAAIGGGQHAPGTVSIDGGDVRAANSSYGAAVGGGGGSAAGDAAAGGGGGGAASHGIGASGSANIGEVTVRGGNIALKAAYGAGIGNGGNADKQANKDGIGGRVYIHAGTVYAETDYSSAIGSGINNGIVPEAYIDKGADIMAFGRYASDSPGIDCGDPAGGKGANHGDGLFVNASFGSGLSSKGELLLVFRDGSLSDPVRAVLAPFEFHSFSFTTGEDASMGYNAYTGSLSQGLWQVVRANGPGGPVIYSVKRPHEYKENGDADGSHAGSMAVAHGGGEGHTHYLVTEKHVGVGGEQAAGDTMALVPNGGSYAKANALEMESYIYIGHIWDKLPSKAGEWLSPNEPNEAPSSNRTIYYVYAPYFGMSDVTVGLEVEGDYADNGKEFKFTAHFQDAGGNKLAQGTTFSYRGGAIPGMDAAKPKDGAITLGKDGNAVFYLAHGQTITFADVPSDTLVKVVEIPHSNFTTKFTDSKGTDGAKDRDASLPHDTGFTAVGAGERTFHFINTRRIVNNMIIDVGKTSSRMLPLLTALAILPLAAITVIKRRLYR